MTDAEAAAADGEPRPAPGEAGDAEDEASALREELEEVQAEKLRLLAEFRNFRQRMERERLRIRTDAACGFFSGLLPIVHDLERARDAVWGGEGEAGGASIGEGIDLVLKRLADFMRREGVVEVDPIGEPFHEGTMEAMGMIPSETHAEGRVAQVFQKGLLLGERLIEPARVLVSSGPATDAGADDDADDAQ